VLVGYLTVVAPFAKVYNRSLEDRLKTCFTSPPCALSSIPQVLQQKIDEVEAENIRMEYESKLMAGKKVGGGGHACCLDYLACQSAQLEARLSSCRLIICLNSFSLHGISNLHVRWRHLCCTIHGFDPQLPFVSVHAIPLPASLSSAHAYLPASCTLISHAAQMSQRFSLSRKAGDIRAKHSTYVGLVIEGGVLAAGLQKEHHDKFMELCGSCRTVVCCRWVD
jgi:hypothetical protein